MVGRKKPLKVSEPLLLRIRNGDFEHSPYFDEAESMKEEAVQLVEHLMKTLHISNESERYQEAMERTKMKRVKRLKLLEVADVEEKKRLRELKLALEKEFDKVPLG